MSIAEFRGPHSVTGDDPGRGDPGRVPPQDEVAEQSVLGSMMLSKDAIADVVEVIRGADFYRPAHELIYDAILDLYGRGEPVDAITVSAELTRSGDLARVGGGVYIHTLVAGVPVTANAGYYAEIVREKAILRRLVEAGTKITQLGYAAEGQVDDVVDRAQAEVYAVTERRASEDYAPLADLMELTIDELEAIGNRDGAMGGVPTGFAELDELTNGLHPGQMVIVAARPAVGKALALDTPLATPTGWTTMADVSVGDLLLGSDGLPTRVVAATDVMCDRPCYRVEFSDGTSIIADAHHEWPTTTRDTRLATRERRPARHVFAGTSRDRLARLSTGGGGDERRATTHEPVAVVGHGCQNVTHRVVSAVETMGRETRTHQVALHSYDRPAHVSSPTSLLRALTAPVPQPMVHTQAAAHPTTTSTEEIAASLRCQNGRANHAIENARPLQLPEVELPVPPYALGAWLGDGRSDGVSWRSCRLHRGTATGRLRTRGILRDKHIPMEFLRASEAQRRALLAGLLDADGTVTAGGSVRLALTSQRLVSDVLELVVSLGYTCHVTTTAVGRRPDSSTAHLLCFSARDDVFGSPRKREEHRSRRGTGTDRIGRRYITDVVSLDSVPVRCVEVDNATHTYLAGRSMVPTHNSTLGLDIARSASIRHGLTSAIFSLEMSRTEITMRLLSAEARIPLNHMRNGKMSDDDWNKLVRKMGEVSEAPLFIDDSPNLTMMEIRAKARRLRQRHDLRLIVVDYLQLMTSGKKTESRQVEVSEFSRQIKLLAKELEVPVVAIAQLNRGSEQRTSKRPLLSDLRESGALEQDADVVILLHREDMYERESTRPGEADLIVAKHRNGPTADIVLAFQGHYSRFVDMAQN